jgi:hypothetical protein
MANEALAFLLEVSALAALAHWGYSTGTGETTKIALAIVAPLLAALVWGIFAAPKATVTLPVAGQLAVKALVFGAAVAALIASGTRALAAVYGALVIVNTTIVTIDRRRRS